MIRTLVDAAAGVVSLLAATSAAAQDYWYARAGVGHVGGEFDLPLDVSVAPPFGGAADLEDGWAGSLAFGAAFANGWRLEGEFAASQSDIQSTSSIAPGSEFDSQSLFLNGYYDFNRGAAFQPYLGAGVGFAQIDGRATNIATLPEDSVGFDDEATGLAYRLSVGFGLALSERAALDIGAQYSAVPDLEFSGHGANAAPATFDADLAMISVFVALRWRLGG